MAEGAASWLYVTTAYFRLHMRKLLTVLCLLLFVGVVRADAQVVVGAWTGATTDHHSTSMLMADIGTRVDIEPWVQNYGQLVQVGADVIVPVSHGVGVTAGIYSNTRTERYGLVYMLGNFQGRVTRTNTGEWQGLLSYNVYIRPRVFVNVWVAPAQSSSAYLVGLGYLFRK